MVSGGGTLAAAIAAAALMNGRFLAMGIARAVPARRPGQAEGLRDPRSRTVAALGAAIAPALVPSTPPGVTVLAAASAALLGGRDLPAAMIRVVALMAPALLAALVVTVAFADGRHFHVGAETVGMLAGGALLWRGTSVVLAVLVTVLVTAGLRAVI